MYVRIPILIFIVAISSMAFSKNMAHVHLKHVYEAWHTTPNNAGFLEIVNADAVKFQSYIQLAIKESDLSKSKRHLSSALLLLKGDAANNQSLYGLIPANEGVWKHTLLANQSLGASRDFRAKGDQIAALAKSCEEQLIKLQTLTEQAMTKTSTSEFTGSIREIKTLSDSIFASQNSTYADINREIESLRKQEGLM